jgi:hypothetical protein
MNPFRWLQASLGPPPLDLAGLDPKLSGKLAVGLTVVTRHDAQSTACTRDHARPCRSMPVIVGSMSIHRAARLSLAAGAGLLAAYIPDGSPMIAGAVLLTVSVLAVTLLLALSAGRADFERLVVLLCILRRIDPRPYIDIYLAETPGQQQAHPDGRPVAGGRTGLVHAQRLMKRITLLR